MSPSVRSYGDRHTSLYPDGFKFAGKRIKMALRQAPERQPGWAARCKMGDSTVNSVPVAGLQGENRHTLLIVDDDSEIRSLLAEQLEAVGYTVHTAANGAEMYSLLNGTAIDLIILDLNLPGQNGLTLCRETRTR